MAHWEPHIFTVRRRQVHFIFRSSEAVPEVWADLRERALPLYVSTFNVRNPLLEKELGEWGKRWNLTAEWCRKVARDSVQAWHGNPGWMLPCPTHALAWEAPARPAAPQWPPLEGVVTGHYLDALDEHIAALQRHRREVKALLEGEGWREAPEHPEGAYRWLALYQCRGESAEAVSLGEGEDAPNAESIHKAVKRLAADLALPLRAGRRGPKLDTAA